MKQFQFPISKIEDMQAIDVYHTHNWDHIIKHWDEDSKRNENPALREFYFDLQDMLEFLSDYLSTLTYKEAIFASLYGGRFVGIPYTKEFIPCVDELTKWLHANNMRINSSAGLLVTKKELLDCIGMISECGFMGMTRLFILIPESGVAITAHHHMNYLIYTNDFNKQRLIIKKIIDMQNTIDVYFSK
ncbi:hypothetical protein SAMN02745168_1168 [Papillibacter cinnamivorans DSM 12816]|uniref:Uncharacterized protein n=2 Tax=Papillibacter TaxID=100175 RepID=A0A1W1ZJI1_9FIRM|nr:hypothetical protein SAMN02745168_1168 [Papillibacter cinnamivorans DSM 12816]